MTADGAAYDFNAPVKSNLKLYATWGSGCRVTYHYTANKTEIEFVQPGDTAPFISATRPGYDFGGWYADKELQTAFDFDTTVINADTDIYAKWTQTGEVDLTKYTIKATDQTYTGKALKPALVVTDGTNVLIEGDDYTASFSNNTKVGAAAVTVTGNNVVKGTLTGKFNIIPKATKLTGAKAKKGKKITVSWKTQSGATGYALYRSTSKNGSYTKVKELGKSKTSFTDTKLKKGKKYFYKVKVIQTVSGVTYISDFSNLKYAVAK